MKIRYAAAFSALTVLVAGLYSAFVMRPGLDLVGVLLPRQVWLAENSAAWILGSWLWLLAILGWMLLLITLMWSYSPAHRVATMLQSGLMTIAAVLGIGGVVIWMSLLPFSVMQEDAYIFVPMADMLALGFCGAGLFMGGAVTAWIAIDLARQRVVPAPWLVAPLVAGLAIVPAPFVLPGTWLPAIGAFIWLLWCLFLTTRTMPNAYAEWT